MNHIGVLRILVCVLLLCVIEAKASEMPKADKGIIDARTWDFSKNKILLTGQWLYFEHQLAAPQEIDSLPSTYSAFPALWNDFRNSKSGIGFATYSVKILISPNTIPLSIDIPQIYSNYKIWVNKTLIAENGVVGKSKEESIPQWLPQTATITTQTDTLNLVIQISNFHHYKGGSKDAISLGNSIHMQEFRNWIIRANLAESIILLLLSITFSIIYFKKGQKKIVMYFLLLCLTWSIRTVFSDQYIFISFFPQFNWELMLKIEYLTLYFTMIWAILFLGRLFVNESSKWLKYFLVGGNIVFVVFTILTPAISYTRWLPAYLGFSFILIAYGILIVIMALLNDRTGVMSVVIGVILGLLIFGYDLLSFEGYFVHNSIIFSLSYITIFLFLGIALLRHLNMLKNTNSHEMNFDDMFNKK